MVSQVKAYFSKKKKEKKERGKIYFQLLFNLIKLNLIINNFRVNNHSLIYEVKIAYSMYILITKKTQMTYFSC